MRPRRLLAPLTLVAALAVALPACSGPTSSGPEAEPGTGSRSATADPPDPPGPTAEPSEPADPAPGTVPPAWLGTRVLPRTAQGFGEVRPTPRALRVRRFTLPDPVAALPGRGFASRVVDPAPRRVLARSTWAPGCPVGRDELAWLRVTFRGFDGARHTGELLVNSGVADDVVEVFGALWRAGFPLERVRIATMADLDAPPTGDGNDTGAFVCRATRGSTTFSEHAYGTAIDLNPFQNPYLRSTADGEVVLPELASAYLDRSRVRPGMITADGPVVRAFARIGWGWGGAWRSLKDYQHFSATGR